MKVSRITELDGLRGVAILMVIIWHYFSNQIKAPDYSPLEYFINCFDLFWSGVDLFFVLSGFLICGILLDSKGSSNSFQVFYLRRALRIFPLYFLTCFTFFVFLGMGFGSLDQFKWLAANPMPFWSYFTFTQNFFMGQVGDYGANWLGMTWSLAVEEQFYLLLPVLIWCLPRRILLIVFISGILLPAALRFAFPGFHSSVGLPWRMDSLFFGALVALVLRSKSATSFLDMRKSIILVFFGILAMGFAVLTLKPLLFGEKIFNIFKFTWLAFFYSSLLWIILRNYIPILNHLLANRLLSWFGMVSYGIYMFHQPISGLLHGILRQTSPAINSFSDLCVTLFSLLITVSLAALSYHFMEKKLIKFGQNKQYKFA